MTIRTASRVVNRRPSTRQLLEHLEPRVLLSITSLAAPSNLLASVNSPTSIQLNGNDHATNAAGYYVLRSSDGTHFSQLTKLTSSSAHSFTDNSALTGHRYTYEVEAYSATL